MANPEHLAKLMEGVAAWNLWRQQNPATLPELSGADLSNANLRFMNLELANLDTANLSNADLVGSSLRSASLRGTNLSAALIGAADLSGAHLSEANLTGAMVVRSDLRNADLREATLLGTDLKGTSLDGLNLDLAIVGYTVFGDVDLRGVLGLETVRHLSTSIVGIETIYQSQGKIPLAFLRGAGVPDNFIDYMGLLTSNAIEFRSCFISYSTQDQEFADRLYADLQSKGVRCWYAPHQDLQGGRKISEQIDAATGAHDLVLLILSQNSIRSEWVKAEIAKALRRELQETRRLLFPISLVSSEELRNWKCFDAGRDLAGAIREFFILDFSDWKNQDAYAKSMLQLTADLTSASTVPMQRIPGGQR